MKQKQIKKELIGETIFGGKVYLSDQRSVNGWGYLFEAEVPGSCYSDWGESKELYSSCFIRLFKDPDEVLKSWGMKNNNLSGELRKVF